ncbi:MAG TPA: PAC2 family protein [Acidimicrobiia bacterium]|nr:PAC2 family protein [Acidimicrobiia bacterium]
MLSVEHWPDLTEPLIVVALTGWVDAGGAGAGAMAVLSEQLEDARTFGSIDVAEVADLQQTRPVARWEGDTRVIDWPRITFECGRLSGGRESAGRDVVLARGPEPSLRWPTIASTVVDAARRLGVRQAVTLGGIPSLVSHRKAAVVSASATQRSLAQELVPLRPDYVGPTGLQTVILRGFGDAGIPGVGLWAQVPQYVSGSPSPPSIRALLGRLVEVYHLDLDLRVLDDRTRAYLRRVEAGLAARPDVKAVVDQIDQRQEGQEGTTGDLVAEIEQFLRSQADGGDT